MGRNKKGRKGTGGVNTEWAEKELQGNGRDAKEGRGGRRRKGKGKV